MIADKREGGSGQAAEAASELEKISKLMEGARRAEDRLASLDKDRTKNKEAGKAESAWDGVQRAKRVFDDLADVLESPEAAAIEPSSMSFEDLYRLVNVFIMLRQRADVRSPGRHGKLDVKRFDDVLEDKMRVAKEEGRAELRANLTREENDQLEAEGYEIVGSNFGGYYLFKPDSAEAAALKVVLKKGGQ